MSSSSKVLKRKKESFAIDQDCQLDVKRNIQCQSKRLGEEDSWYKDTLFSLDESLEILKEIDEQIVHFPREQFKLKIVNTINLLPRDKAFYGDVNSDGSCKHNQSKVVQDIHLKSGSLFVLGWKTNSVWKHSIVKAQRPCERRISLTYRLIKTIMHRDGTLAEIDDSNFSIQNSFNNNSNENENEHEVKKDKII
ncbi:unnamed protein product [Rotaria magnacalcarata]|uniref:Alpha-ketoglutarate-dependent dioxygenase AlkB-like domain-containing protein n=1 Tax=Rotaria magnacalcarata TaxID=392030 RepID=A0A816XNH1_9BILA|nr:unnamed protein product [Rotaria magnacalcarata]CAF3748283.1 unnamed protein product [Rotaria magnacalcarata]